MNSIRKIIFGFLVLFTTQFYAQNGQRYERIKSLKVAFITERLNLSSEEAQMFWPVYNDYEENREALRQKKRMQVHAKIRGAENLTEKEAQDLIARHLSYEKEEKELEAKFIADVSQVISARKTLFLLRSEEEFKRELIKQFRQKRNGGRP